MNPFAWRASCGSSAGQPTGSVSIPFFFFITRGQELSETKVCEPEIRALLGTALYFCEALVLKVGTVPSREGIKDEEEGTAIMGQKCLSSARSAGCYVTNC